MGGVLAGTQIAKLNDKEKLSDLRDEITEQLGIKPFKTSHWERKRDKFLAWLTGLQSQPSTEAKGAMVPPEDFPGATVTTSGQWLKLDDAFYRADRFERHGRSSIHLQLTARTPEEDARLNLLRPHDHGRGRTIGIAYQNEAGMARIEKATSVSQGGNNVWSLELTFEEGQQGCMWNECSYSFDNRHYSPDDIAEIRAGRMLINNPPPPRRRSRGYDVDSLESILAGSGDLPVKTDECVVRSIVAQNRDNLEKGLSWARLESVFRLKVTKTVESILELSLGPVVGDKLHVRFRGQRPFRYEGETPETITVEGNCDLT